MRRPIALLAVVLALQLGLAAALAVRENPLASTTPQTPLIAAPLDQVDRVVIEAPVLDAHGPSADAGRVELAKHAGHWILPDYFNAPADPSKLASMLGTLGSLKRGLPIATSAAALKRFKLVKDDFERRLVLSQGGRVLSTVYFGSSAGVRKSDARTAADQAVYNVDLATYELPTAPSDWLDADLLRRDPASLTELDITAAGTQAAVTLTRAGGASPSAAESQAHSPAWIDPSLGRKIDGARADALARDVAQLRVDAVLGLTAKPEWQQEHPLLTLRMADAQHPGQLVTWTLSKPVASTGAPAQPTRPTARPTRTLPQAASGADYYVLKASAQPWYFRVSSATGKQLLDDSSPQALFAAAGPPSSSRR